jgi:hypothetical protein
MPEAEIWEPLSIELARWQEAGRVADLWLRDDDAIEPTAALDRLVAASAGAAIPLTLAVIPARVERALAERVAGEQAITAAVHGWAHANHAPATEKKQELGPHRAADVVLAEVSDARIIVDSLFGAAALPMLVPPWNRIDPALLPSIAGIGFTAASAFGRAKAAPIRMVNAHVDLIDWHGGRNGKDHGLLVRELVAELQQRLDDNSREPVGLLSHHLVHDDTAWSFLERLFDITSGNPACRWASARELM